MTFNICGVKSNPQRFLYLRDLYEDNICIISKFFFIGCKSENIKSSLFVLVVVIV